MNFLRSFAVATMVLMVGSPACGSSDPEPSAETGPPNFLLQLDPGGADAWEFTPPDVREVIADGDLTFAEYEEATLTVVACLEELGAQILDFRLDPTGRFFEYGVAHRDGTSDVMNTCERERGHGYLVYLWKLQNRPGVEERIEAEALVIECVDERGHEDMPVTNDPAFGAWLTADPDRLGVFDACIEEVEAETGVRIGS